ncbi:hypothetical protein FZC76_11525 [Sutcliffiella horikoshii]|uniref:GerMN domain-containing protein n=1 Tax=Sutcliffiella horikoshii TaxID=79883 RepID=A0A5D4T260_9BACI|nr:hypothetical protein [Sutcliffiella horikoshii]TYS68354.1 hypothetical protein FZC76_11525 [Sutcliffiella horikoshii]
MRHNDEDQMEKLLRQMPKIKDDRDPKQIYREIQPKLENSPRRSKIVPAFALVAALVLFAMVAPMFINNMQFDMSLSGSDSSSEESMDMATMNEDEASDDSAADTSREALEEESSLKLEGEEETNDFAAAEIHTAEGKSFVTSSYNEGSEYAVTIGVSLMEADNLEHGGSTTPLTVIVPRGENDTYVDALNKIRGAIPYEDYGTIAPTINDNVKISEGDIGLASPMPILVVTDMAKGLTSHQNRLFPKELSDTFSTNYTHILFSDNGSTNGVEIGNRVYDGPVELPTKNKRAYFKYYTGSLPLLVAGHDRYFSIGDALTAMTVTPKQADTSKLEPSIPDTVKVEKLSLESDRAVVRIKLADSSVLENNDETIFALEAMMMVAKEFGLRGVVFESSQNVTIGTITLNQEVSVPYSPNPIPYTE